jgi:hypothetical protein
MKREIFLLTFICLLILMMSSCGGTSTTSNEANAANGNANGISNANSHPGMTTTRNDEPTVNNAPTLNPVVQQYYEALKDKDDAKLRDTMTAEFQKNIDDDMKSQNRKDFAAFVAETDYRAGQVIETRNEKIEGDKGTAELRGGPYKNWTAFEFAKENGKWKFTGRSPEIESMPKTNSNVVSPH